jgi:ADP-ribosyl-[dinitrogen reductase] hydrolase
MVFNSFQPFEESHAHRSGMSRQSSTLKERALGAYIGLAIGDALGATTEFLTPGEIEERYGVHDTIRGGGWLKLKAGSVTDDTEMSLALGNSIIDRGGVEACAVAEAFSAWMRGKPIDIGNTVRRGIVHYRTTGECRVSVNEYDAGNGACMRTLPIALFYCHGPDEALREASRLQAHTTHNNPLSDAGTEAVLMMLRRLFGGEEKAVVERIAQQLVAEYPQYRYDKRQVNNPSGYIVETLQVVFQAFFRQDDFESVLIDVVNRGGDADTTGAIAGMLAGACYGLSGIPQHWQRQLKGEVTAACEQQTLRLLALADKCGGKAS